MNARVRSKGDNTKADMVSDIDRVATMKWDLRGGPMVKVSGKQGPVARHSLAQKLRCWQSLHIPVVKGAIQRG